MNIFVSLYGRNVRTHKIHKKMRVHSSGPAFPPIPLQDHDIAVAYMYLNLLILPDTHPQLLHGFIQKWKLPEPMFI
jgi:hypothetical protein